MVESAWLGGSNAMTEAHPNARLEAFCDGVFAIALTLLILEVKLPAMESIASTPELWRALEHLLPSVLAFVLSFVIILITWVNHRATLRLVHSSSARFLYANGFLLLTVVSIPFPTAMLGAFIRTDHAAPAVVLYNAVLAAQAIGWILVTGAALRDQLIADESSKARIRVNNRHGFFAFALYSLFAIAAFWFPVAVVVVTTLSWAFWLVLGMRMKHAWASRPAAGRRSATRFARGGGSGFSASGKPCGRATRARPARWAWAGSRAG